MSESIVASVLEANPNFNLFWACNKLVKELQSPDTKSVKNDFYKLKKEFLERECPVIEKHLTPPVKEGAKATYHLVYEEGGIGFHIAVKQQKWEEHDVPVTPPGFRLNDIQGKWSEEEAVAVIQAWINSQN